MIVAFLVFRFLLAKSWGLVYCSSTSAAMIIRPKSHLLDILQLERLNPIEPNTSET